MRHRALGLGLISRRLGLIGPQPCAQLVTDSLRQRLVPGVAFVHSCGCGLWHSPILAPGVPIHPTADIDGALWMVTKSMGQVARLLARRTTEPMRKFGPCNDKH